MTKDEEQQAYYSLEDSIEKFFDDLHKSYQFDNGLVMSAKYARSLRILIVEKHKQLLANSE